MHKSVMESEIGRQILTPQTAGPQNLRHVLIGRLAAVSHRQEERNIGVIGPRQRVLHEHVGIGVMQTDTLIVTDLALDRIRPEFNNAASAGLQCVIGGIQSRLERVRQPRDALGLGQLFAMCGQQHHGLNQGLHDKGIVRIIGIGKTHGIAELGDAMLYLNSGIHLHEKVLITIDNTLKGRHRVQAYGLSETCRLGLHRVKRLDVLSEHRGFIGSPRLCRTRLSRLKRLTRHRHLEQFLLVHLQRAVSATQCDAPITIPDHLDLLMPGSFDIEFNKDVLVVTNARGLYFIENLANQLWRALGLTQRHDALPLAATAANGLQAHPVLRVLLAHLQHRLGQRLAEFVDGVEVYPLTITRGQHRLSQRLQVICGRLTF